MSAPTFVAQGTSVQLAGGSNVAWPAGHQADDIGILYVQTGNEVVATPSGWTICPDSPQGAGTGGAAGATRISTFWKRATSSAEADAVVADAGDHIKARILVFRGCETSGSPFDDSAGDSDATVQTAVTIPGIVTTVDECLVLAAVANGTDTTANQTVSNGFSNASLTSLARIMTSNTNVGNGGGIDVAAGVKTTAGTVNTTLVTLSTASAQARLTLALMPPQGAGTVTNGGVYVATGIKATAGAVGNTTATLDTSSAQARISIALKPETSAPVNTAPILGAISDKTVKSNTLLSFPITATDAEGDTLTYELLDGGTPVPAGATLITDEAGLVAFDWTPTGDQVGEYNVIVKVTDDDASPLSSQQAFNIVVTEGPRGPFGSGVSGALNSVV